MGESLREWLDDRVGRSAGCERALREDGRDDEATLERIRGNVFDIARTVLGVAARQDDDGAARSFFTGRMGRLHGEWRAARERALEHGDEESAHVEQVKLEALSEVLRATDDLRAV